ncbi:GtrA-like protein [compost metagenome]
MNTGVDFIVYTLLMLVGVHYLAAQVVSYAAGTVNSYVVNKLWTFKGQRPIREEEADQGNAESGNKRLSANRREFLRFALLNGGTLLLSLVLLYALKSGLGLHALIAKLLVTGVTVVANYIGSKLWVFRS